MDVFELYESLRNVSRTKNGELFIEGFEDEDYEDLYYMMLDILRPYFGGDYTFWYVNKARSYHRHKQRYRHTWDWYDPQLEPIEQQTIRQQLVVLKWFTQRRYYGKFPSKCERGVL